MCFHKHWHATHSSLFATPCGPQCASAHACPCTHNPPPYTHTHTHTSLQRASLAHQRNYRGTLYRNLMHVMSPVAATYANEAAVRTGRLWGVVGRRVEPQRNPEEPRGKCGSGPWPLLLQQLAAVIWSGHKRSSWFRFQLIKHAKQRAVVVLIWSFGTVMLCKLWVLHLAFTDANWRLSIPILSRKLLYSLHRRPELSSYIYSEVGRVCKNCKSSTTFTFTTKVKEKSSRPRNYSSKSKKVFRKST